MASVLSFVAKSHGEGKRWTANSLSGRAIFKKRTEKDEEVWISRTYVYEHFDFIPRDTELVYPSSLYIESGYYAFVRYTAAFDLTEEHEVPDFSRLEPRVFRPLDIARRDSSNNNVSHRQFINCIHKTQNVTLYYCYIRAKDYGDI